MKNQAFTPTAEQVAQQFEVKTLEPRMEMLVPYGRDREQPTPSVGE